MTHQVQVCTFHDGCKQGIDQQILNRDMCKFESSQKDESRWQSTDSSKAYRNTSAFKCHQVQCNISTFEAVLRKNMHLFLERCRKSNNVIVACFDAVRLFIFFLVLSTLQPHFTLWLSARTLQCLFVGGCTCHNEFAFYLD